MLDAVPGGRGRSKDDVRARVSDTLSLILCEYFLVSSGRVEKAGCSRAPTCPSALKEATLSCTHIRGTCFIFNIAAGPNILRVKAFKSVFSEETH